MSNTVDTCMTLNDIRAHAATLQDRLTEERARVRNGQYTGHPAVNLRLIAGLEGRVAELLELCDLYEAKVRAAAGLVPAA